MSTEGRQSIYVSIVFAVVALLDGVIIAETDKAAHRALIHIVATLACICVGLVMTVWIIRSGGVPLKDRLRIVCWEGYKPIIANMSSEWHRRYAVAIIAITYIGKGIYSTLKSIPANIPVDLIIFDIEALPDLINPKSIDTAMPESRYLVPYETVLGEAFTQPMAELVFDNFIAADQNKIYGFPLRFGVNALSFNTSAISPEQLRNYCAITDPNDDTFKAIVSQRKVGIWDWYLPTMGTLSVALGHKRPFDLSRAEFTALKAAMKRLLPGVYDFYKEPRSLIAALEAGFIWLVPGGGEWHVPVRAASRYKKTLSTFRIDPILLETFEQRGLFAFRESQAELTTHIDWVIPAEGGMFWVECVGVCNEFTKHSKDRFITQDMLRDLLEQMFLNSWRQQEFSRLEFHRANTVVRNAIQFFPPGQKKLLHTYTDKAIEYRTKSLIRRQYPPRAREVASGEDCVAREEWEQFWDQEFHRV